MKQRYEYAKWQVFAWGFIAAVALMMVVEAHRAEAKARGAGYVVTQEINTPNGREKCYVLVVPAGAFKIQIPVVLGCWPLGPGQE